LPEEKGMATRTDELPRYLNGNDAAAYTGLHPSTIYRHIREKRLRAVKLSGVWWCLREDLDRLRPTTANLDALLAGEL
jgi:excisionase family DNA binding protein